MVSTTACLIHFAYKHHHMLAGIETPLLSASKVLAQRASLYSLLAFEEMD